MKKLLPLITLLCLLILQTAFTQIERTYHWYFGDKAGIDFSSEQPVAVTDGEMSVLEGCSSISDKNGNLLMYTDGKSVWNRNHQIMPNGTGLGMPTSTPAQSSVIVPMPSNDRYYYIFHLTTHDWKKDGKETHGLKYSVVDMDLDGGMGDLIEKNNLLLEPVSEALDAVMHKNCEDVWIVVHKKGTNDFYAYLITKNGLLPPVITTIGNFPHIPSFPWISAYLIKFSHDGNKMACSAFWDHMNTHILDTLHLFDFNRSSGMLSNPILISDTAIGAFGFSPDNTKLYVHVSETDCFTYQYDILSNNQNDILASKTLIYYDEYWNHNDFQNAKGEIIVAVKAYQPFVSIIYEPNKQGVACNLVDSALYLNGRYGLGALPEFVKSYFDYGANSCFTKKDTNNTAEHIFVPNIFSPNDDGINDILYVYGKNFKTIRFLIYNRWGQLVFETLDISHGWDGTFKSRKLNPAVFVYYLEAVLENGQKISKSGDITLIK